VCILCVHFCPYYTQNLSGLRYSFYMFPSNNQGFLRAKIRSPHGFQVPWVSMLTVIDSDVTAGFKILAIFWHTTILNISHTQPFSCPVLFIVHLFLHKQFPILDFKRLQYSVSILNCRSHQTANLPSSEIYILGVVLSLHMRNVDCDEHISLLGGQTNERQQNASEIWSGLATIFQSRRLRVLR